MSQRTGGNHQFLETGRPAVEGRNGAVTSPHYLASLAGKSILEKGGHAVEAAITINSVLCVVYPHMAGLGGDLFALVWDKSEKEVRALNGSGKSGRNVTREKFFENDLDEIPDRGPLAANTVPGTVDAWWELHQQYGKLQWEELFESAIHYAEKGFPLTDKVSDFIREEKELLQMYPETEKMFLTNNQAPESGEVFIQPELAWSLKQIASEGRDVFYKGEIADKIVAAFEKHGGLLTKEDFETHKSIWDKPISNNYKGFDVYQVRPNTQGIAMLMMLNLLEKHDLTRIADGTPDYYHLMAEAAKINFSYRDEWVTDPDHIKVPYDELLSETLSEEINKHFSLDKVFHADHFNDLPEVKKNRDTVYMSTVDEEGNSVSLIQSIFHEFGSGFVPEGCGFLFQNRGSYFSLEENHPNRLEPNKRTFHTIMPAMVMKDDKPFMLFGSMGGEGQPQTQCALLTRVVDFGYNIQQAIEAPRWLYGKTWGEDSSTLKLEGRIPDSILHELEKRGHMIERTENFSQTMGHAQGIILDHEKGIYSAGADPRGDGIAVSW
ncbi:gamma-glutamyltransferase [Virgibacillus kimchii]